MDNHFDSFELPFDTMERESNPFVPYFVDESDLSDTNEDGPWIESEWEFEDDNFVFTLSTSICMLSMSSLPFANTDDGISLVYP